MKKRILCGLSAPLLLAMLGFFGCSAQQPKSEYSAAKPRAVTPKITVTTEEEERVESSLPTTEDGPSGGACQTDDNCTVIPVPAAACFPCGKNASQKAVTIEEARAEMGPHRDVCKPQHDALRNGGKHPERSNNQECQFNGAKCVEGSCQLATLTQAELEAHHKRRQGGQQGAPQGGGQSFGGQGGQGAGYGNSLPSASYANSPIGSSPFGSRAGTSPFGSHAGHPSFGAQPGSSQWGAQPGSSPWGAQAGSSPFGAQPGSSPWGAQVGSSPFGTQPGSSQWGAQPGSSPFGAQPGSSPWGAQAGYGGQGTPSYGSSPWGGQQPGGGAYGNYNPQAAFGAGNQAYGAGANSPWRGGNAFGQNFGAFPTANGNEGGYPKFNFGGQPQR